MRVGTGFDAGGVFIVILIRIVFRSGQHIFCFGCDGTGPVFICFRKLIGDRSRDLAEKVIPHCFTGDDGDIPRGGIVIIIVITVGIFEMGIDTADVGSRFIHQVHKMRNVPGNSFRDYVGPVIGRQQHRTVKNINKPDFLSGLQIHRRRIGRHVDCRFRHRHHLLRIIHIQDSQQHRQDFCHGCRITHSIRVFFEDDFSLILCHQDG